MGAIAFIAASAQHRRAISQLAQGRDLMATAEFKE